MVKKNKINLVVYHSDFNSTEFLTEVLSQVLGYHFCQAATCAQIITNSGSYVVKTFSQKDKFKAESFYELLVKNDIPTKLSYV
jgi:ATP-dependent Clp protease adapter protein ClpS